jgi:glycosyltransferase involved in cell wall biosynthesis
LGDVAEANAQIGYLRRIQGDTDTAIRHFGRAVAAAPHSAAVAELAAPEVAARLDATARRALARHRDAALRAIGARSDGVDIVAGHGILVSDDGAILFASPHSWIEIRLHPESAGAFVLLSLDADGQGGWDADNSLSTRLSIDYGEGLLDDDIIYPADAGDGGRTWALALPAAILRARYFPGRAPNVLKAVRATALAVDDRELASWVRAPGAAALAEVVAATRAVMGSGAPADAIDARRLQRRLLTTVDERSSYAWWCETFVDPDDRDRAAMGEIADGLRLRPTFSFIIPVYDPPLDLLRQCLDSLLAQNYPTFNICVANDRSTDAGVAELLAHYADADSRVRIVHRDRNGHISAASNSALAIARGDYVVLVDQDDLIPDYALLLIAYYINKYPDAAILYSDEDKIDRNGRRFDPYFKGKFNEFLMYGHNMISHLGIYRWDIVEKIGGFRLGFEGSQDYDLFLRAYEQIDRAQLIHIPHVLYHWRAIPGSTAMAANQKCYAVSAARDALNGYFERNALPLRSEFGFAAGCTAIRGTRTIEASVTIIVCTRDGLEVLRRCVDSVLASAAENFDLLIVDNGSTEAEALAYLTTLAQEPWIRVVRDDRPFNFASLNNAAATLAAGDVLCFLNNDVEVKSPHWLDRARMLLSLPDVAVVGARLIYPDGTLQHFGLAIGMGEHGVADMPHVDLPADSPGYFGKARLIQEVSAVTAACMFVRRADFETVGGFDPALAVAYNDVDLCLRFRALDKRIVCDPEIEAIHRESYTRSDDRSADKAARLGREAAHMAAKWGDILAHDPYVSPNLVLRGGRFSFATPPRVPLPWRTENPARIRAPTAQNG